ncbi:MarR family winged helix-turn-helix transcriptional regulator [Wukongibacter sp. M2B1]|uniref:MarR family winged helix-turn-helix transcriptional regulator n=1 Tax=Wukongibacter sp. M2B1 TaxID=3088895 RepID=UPI003D7BF5E1
MNAFNIGKKIRGSMRNVKAYISQELKNHNISEGQFEYFLMIYENEGINQKDLADLMNVGKASVTKSAKKLLEEGLIERKVNEKDQRNYGLYISEKGKSYSELFKLISTEITKTVFKDFSIDEIEDLQHLLSKLEKNSKNFNMKND